MRFHLKLPGLVLALCLAGPLATAQVTSKGQAVSSGAVAAASAAPAPPHSPAAPASSTYRSAFEGYRGFKEETPVPWKRANETVGRIGGWKAYASEAQDESGAAGAPQKSGQPMQQGDAPALPKTTNPRPHESHGAPGQH